MKTEGVSQASIKVDRPPTNDRRQSADNWNRGLGVPYLFGKYEVEYVLFHEATGTFEVPWSFGGEKHTAFFTDTVKLDKFLRRYCARVGGDQPADVGCGMRKYNIKIVEQS